MPETVCLEDKFATFTETWSPRIVARYEGHEVRIAKLEGEFVWHQHDHDELFLAIGGELDVEFRDGTRTMQPGDLLLIPAHTEHRPVAKNGTVKLMILNPGDAPNTGDPATATLAIDA